MNSNYSFFEKEHQKSFGESMANANHREFEIVIFHFLVLISFLEF